MNKKVLKSLALAAIFLSLIFSLASCQMYSQADHYKKNGVATRMSYLTFDVIYDANGGSGQMQTKGYTLGTEVGISGSAFTAPVGLKFHSWNTNPDGTGSMYNPGEKLIINSDDVTLYAIWIDKDAHAINYYNTKGVVGNNPYSFLESKTVQISPLSLDYYTFDGWYTNSSYTGNPIIGWEPGTYSTNVSLWAKWTAITYNVSYDYNDGQLSSGQYNPVTFTVETNFTLRAPKKPGYNFDGWFDQDGNKITVLDSSLIGKDLVLTARYSLAHYTITYHLYNGTNAEENPATYTVEDEITLATPTKTNRDFKGWYPTSARNGTPITKIEKGTTGSIELYAKWRTTDSNTFDIDEEGIGNFQEWLIETLDTTVSDNAIAITGNATSSEVKTLARAFVNNTAYIEEIDLSNLNVTILSDRFIEYATNLKKITLPLTLEYLNDAAFMHCYNLEEIVLNDGLKEIYWSAFGDCPNLKEITIPDSVELIPQTAFWGGTSLEKVNISKNSNLEVIGMGAFRNCNSLKEIYIPPKVNHLNNIGATFSKNNDWGADGISGGSFENCTGLTTVTFCKTLTKINQSTFQGCNSITTINYEGTQEEWEALLPNIGTNNGSLLTATVNYNYVIP